MQLRTASKTLQVGGQDAKISLAIQPQSSAGYVWAGIAIGVVSGFVVGTVLTLLVGEKSLMLIQHVWNRLTGGESNSERVHFELLLQ